MKAVLVWPLCWSLYWLGHCASLVINWMDPRDDVPGRLFDAAFWLYQRPMGASHRLQCWAEGGFDSRRYSGILPWGPPEGHRGLHGSDK